MIAETSIEAYEKLQPELPTVDDRVLAYIAARPDGAINDEIAVELGMKLQTVCGARWRLVQNGIVMVQGRRLNQHGNSCQVVHAVKVAR